ISLAETDVVILEQEKPLLTESILSMENPPLIVVAKEGVSSGNIRYLPDFTAQFPKLLSTLTEKVPLLIFLSKNETYLYRQQDILYIQRDGCLTLHLRSGDKAVTTEGIRKVFSRLSKKLFFPVGKNVMANAMYVSRFCPDGVLMQNGRLIPCSQEELPKAENAFFQTKFNEILPKK
ncbi:MAG: hypothetical protein IJ367_01555, partial [Clostridia bacterium]|nr:hypothetical protein [Clostridia bacterium]